LYLLAFLYAHQEKKVILFVSNCELVNFLWTLLSHLNWDSLGSRSQEIEVDGKLNVMFQGSIYKLHGQLDQVQRKHNYFGFDSKEGSLLICTDVASRGLDFKHVDWIVQYDPSSSIKEYVNRIGRTARMASAGQSLCFLLPEEMEYVKHLREEFKISLMKKERF